MFKLILYHQRWAGQTLGDRFKSDGRMYGDVVTSPVPCDTSSGKLQYHSVSIHTHSRSGSCPVKVPGSSVALVFLSQSALESSSPTPQEATETFSTSFHTKLYNTVTVAQEVLINSNGRGGPDKNSRKLGTTSRQESGAPVGVGRCLTAALLPFITLFI